VSNSEKLGFLKRVASHVDEITHSSRISVTISMIILKIKNKLETIIKEIDVKVINQKIANVCAEVSFV
jgi:pterin-4a-carbinolamine dehydratase